MAFSKYVELQEFADFHYICSMAPMSTAILALQSLYPNSAGLSGDDPPLAFTDRRGRLDSPSRLYIYLHCVIDNLNLALSPTL